MIILKILPPRKFVVKEKDVWIVKVNRKTHKKTMWQVFEFPTYRPAYKKYIEWSTPKKGRA